MLIFYTYDIRFNTEDNSLLQNATKLYGRLKHTSSNMKDFYCIKLVIIKKTNLVEKH